MHGSLALEWHGFLKLFHFAFMFVILCSLGVPLLSGQRRVFPLLQLSYTHGGYPDWCWVVDFNWIGRIVMKFMWSDIEVVIPILVPYII